MKKCMACLLVFLCIIGGIGTDSYAKEEPVLYAKAAVLMDGDTGRVLYGKEEKTVLPMASTTKIMTLILALEYGNPEDVITVSSYASKMPDVKLGLRAGEKYRLYDLLFSMMLESHNDSACAVAEQIGGSVEGFADMMNQKAAEIGLASTYFITPNGLDAEDEKGMHSTTAEDLAKLMRYCTFVSGENEKFREICQTREYSFSDYEGTKTYTVYNKNALLDKMDGVLAGKTGFTGKAGYCYVCAVTVNGKHFIVSLLACGWPHNKHYKWADTKTLLAYGDALYQYREIHLSDYPVNKIPVQGGCSQTVDGSCDEQLTVLLAKEDEIHTHFMPDPAVNAPVAKGDKVGVLQVYAGNMLLAGYPVFASTSIDKKDVSYYIEYVFDAFFY